MSRKVKYITAWIFADILPFGFFNLFFHLFGGFLFFDVMGVTVQEGGFCQIPLVARGIVLSEPKLRSEFQRNGKPLETMGRRVTGLTHFFQGFENLLWRRNSRTGDGRYV